MHWIGKLNCLRAQGGVGDDEARHERTIDRRQAEQARNGGNGKAEGQHGKRNEVGLAGEIAGERQRDLARHVQIPDQPAEDHHSRSDQHQCLPHGLAVTRCAETFGDDQHRHDGDVLGDQHADGDAAGFGTQFTDVIQYLDGDRG